MLVPVYIPVLFGRYDTTKIVTKLRGRDAGRIMIGSEEMEQGFVDEIFMLYTHLYYKRR